MNRKTLIMVVAFFGAGAIILASIGWLADTTGWNQFAVGIPGALVLGFVLYKVLSFVNDKLS